MTMSSDLTSQAVKAALNNNWTEAVKVNSTILEENPQCVEALNRLARAQKELGNLPLALKTYRKVLSCDRFNIIAQKNLKLLEALPKCAKKKSSNSNHCSPQMFLEEPGKTKIVSLVNLAPASILLPLCCGDKVNLLIKRRTVIAVDENENYLGALPDDLSIKLIKRITGGNRYDSYIKTVGKNCLSIFIKELFRANRFKNQPTFPSGNSEFYGFSKSDSSSEDEEDETAEEPVPDEEVASG